MAAMRPLAVMTLTLWLSCPPHASTPPASPSLELVQREEARVAVLTALEAIDQPAAVDAFVERFNLEADRLVAIGPAVVSFLVSELDQGLRQTHPFCAMVLGRIGGAEAEEALRRSMNQADQDDDTGDWAQLRKAWAAWGLGIMGRSDPLDALQSGRRPAAHVPIHNDMAALESVALLSAPSSTKVLIDQLERFGQGEEHQNARLWTLRALRRTADTSAVPKIVALLGAPDRATRFEAARTLGALSGTASLDALDAALNDSDPIVRRSIALSLESLRAGPERLPRYREQLTHETDAYTRGVFYRIIARSAGARALAALSPYVGSADPSDRGGLAEALALGGPSCVHTLRGALGDSSTEVATRAAFALGAIGGEAAREALIGTLAAQRWSVVQSALQALVRARAVEAGPAIAERLVRFELVAVRTDITLRPHIEQLGDALVALRSTARLEELRRSHEGQTDGTLLNYLERLVRQLETLESHGTDIARWKSTLETGAPELRGLTIGRLGELGGAIAAGALVTHFGKAGVDEAEQLEVLLALGRIPEPPSYDLLERVLLDAEFDTRLRFRESAAWSARRLGGERMHRALRQAVERRFGRDARVLVYLGLALGREAIPIFEALRIPRMRSVKWSRGKEQEFLDLFFRDLAAGRSLLTHDRPPDQIAFP